ncbi:hypothetical protein PUN28_011164 [Cardiocondyla obscurior]|uniref:Uncharacterized protein n=1 Tax=Cardiocondyla obscurior TaxID=286306 RepID=A0AAW2FPR2_9HYME
MHCPSFCLRVTSSINSISSGKLGETLDIFEKNHKIMNNNIKIIDLQIITLVIVLSVILFLSYIEINKQKNNFIENKRSVKFSFCNESDSVVYVSSQVSKNIVLFKLIGFNILLHSSEVISIGRCANNEIVVNI